ncbi:unnamed protein product [Citrullus colocynthis]|uniref:Uncharacterized protein n=1 Tax=Citrullus colocynthis TaxID=252529 RepID=A0ABP0YXW1_9ROSI
MEVTCEWKALLAVGKALSRKSRWPFPLFLRFHLPLPTFLPPLLCSFNHYSSSDQSNLQKIPLISTLNLSQSSSSSFSVHNRRLKIPLLSTSLSSASFYAFLLGSQHSFVSMLKFI